MARMIPISSFLPLITIHASAVPHPVAEQQTRLAAIEFCERTRCWRHMIRRQIDVFDGGCGSPSIRLMPPYATIFEWEFAYFNEAKLTPMQFSDVDFTQRDSGDITGPPTHITQTEPGLVALIPPPDASGGLYMSVFLKPIGSDEWSGGTYDMDEDDDLNVLPDFLLTHHAESIARGALARILAIPGQTYTDMPRAAAYAADFHDRMDHRFNNNLRGQQRAPARARPHNF